MLRAFVVQTVGNRIDSASHTWPSALRLRYAESSTEIAHPVGTKKIRIPGTKCTETVGSSTGLLQEEVSALLSIPSLRRAEEEEEGEEEEGERGDALESKALAERILKSQ
eukprot:2963807-Rhodomonas_salina.1